MATIEGELVGRDAELNLIREFVELGASGSRTMVLTGGPGVGKTTLWQTALDDARRNDLRVLVARPSEAESQLALAALADLLADVENDVFAALPTPQAHALEVALLRRDGAGPPPEPRAIAAALLGVLRMFAADQPLVVAIDDVQWLDAASDAALCFAVRRLSGERVRFLFSQRSETSSPLVQALGRENTRLVELGGLSFGAIRAILVDQLGFSAPRRVLRQLYESSQGNPLFALEIGRALAAGGVPTSGDPLPLPADVQALVRQRVAALPDATRELLLAAALLPRPDRSTLEATVGDVAVQMHPADEAGIAAFRGETVVFSHPLHAAGVVAAAADADRRAMHRRLAETAPDPAERARHLARAADRPDERTASLVAVGAAAARERGALHPAAELLERASELTPQDRAYEALVRRVEAAELHFHAGDPTHARALLEAVVARPLARPQRAEVLRLLAEICISEENPPEAERLLLEALELSDDDRGRARIELELTYVIHFSFDFSRGAEHGRRGLELLKGTDDEPLLAEALAYCAIADYLAGAGVDWAKVERALELEDPDRISLPGLPPSGVAGALMMYVGRHASARDRMHIVCSRLADRGLEKDLAHALLWTSWLETRCANFDAAAAAADDAIALAAMSENRTITKWATAQRAWVDAHLGDAAAARARIADAKEGDGDRIPHVHLWSATTLALLGASAGDYASAWEACRPVAELVEANGIAEPVPLMFLPDAIEALIALQDLDRAEALLAEFERCAHALDRTWALATAHRCRGLLHAQHQEGDAAVASLEGALRVHERIDLPFDRGRALLALGTVQRRLRRRREARTSTEAAVAAFEAIGAEGWATRARSELERISGRKPRSETLLTASERRVVDLAVDGLSNKEIASRLVLSVHTVEVHLSHAYRKLGVRSRAQLAGRLAADATDPKV